MIRPNLLAATILTWGVLETTVPPTDVFLGSVDRFSLRLVLPNCSHIVPFAIPGRPLGSHSIPWNKNSVCSSLYIVTRSFYAAIPRSWRVDVELDISHTHCFQFLQTYFDRILLLVNQIAWAAKYEIRLTVTHKQ